MNSLEFSAAIRTGKSEGVLAKVSQQLSQLEKRDGELWLIVSLTGLLVGAGFLAVLYPAAFLKQGNIHFEITVSRPLVLGLVALLALLNTYLLTRRMEIRRLREELISRTIQQELTQQQSFTDPLTEIYNRHSLEDMTNRFISQAQRSNKPLTFMMIDVDHFKDVNTKFGHLTGDVVLANTAALLKHPFGARMRCSVTAATSSWSFLRTPHSADAEDMWCKDVGPVSRNGTGRSISRVSNSA